MIISFESYILEVKNSNKSLFQASKIQMSPEVFEKQLERAFKAGFNYCDDLRNQKETGAANPFGDIFGDIFSNKKK